METLFCFYCGARMNEGLSTCPSCGADNSNVPQYGQPQQNGFQQGTFGQPQPQPQYQQQNQYQQPQGQYVQMNGQTTQFEQPGVQQQNMQGYGQPQYLQQPYAQQQYYNQNNNGSGYIPNAQIVQQPSIISKIVGFVLCLIGFPLTFVFGLGLLSEIFGSGTDMVAVVALMVFTGLSACLSWVGLRQFKTRPFDQRRMIMPTPVQQAYQPYNQPGMQQYGQPGQQGVPPYQQPMLQQPNMQMPNQPNMQMPGQQPVDLNKQPDNNNMYYR